MGFLVFGILIILALRTTLKQLRSPQSAFDKMIALAIFAAMCGVLVHGTVDYLFHTSPQVTALFFLILGLLSAQAPLRTADPGRQAAA